MQQITKRRKDWRVLICLLNFFIQIPKLDRWIPFDDYFLLIESYFHGNYYMRFKFIGLVGITWNFKISLSFRVSYMIIR